MKESKPTPKGKRGEDYTAELLLSRGMRLLARNYHSRYGEVDLIAEDGGELCFVEVKARKAGSMVSGEAAVTPAKQRKILLTALRWMQENGTSLQPRFDVCVVTMKGEGFSHEYYEAAFDGGALHGTPYY
jgi:putative endonuclease